MSTEPRPPESQVLDLSKVEGAETFARGIELRRLRLDRWRVIYAIDENWHAVILLAIRQRPPYDDEDLGRLLAGLSSN